MRMKANTPDVDTIARTLSMVADSLEAAGVSYRLCYGTLLGALRDGDIIPWDDDFDILVSPSDIPAILAMGRLGELRVAPTFHPPNFLAYRDASLVSPFSTCALGLFLGRVKVGDIFWFTLFNDGVLRRWSVRDRVYWCPRSSFPHYFLQEKREVTIRGRVYPGIGHTEAHLAGVYGDDWMVPYVVAKNGGQIRPGTTIYGDRYEPVLKSQIEWCVARGWDQSAYADFPAWPQPVAGAGPPGPTERTVGHIPSLWWRTLDELYAYY